MLPISLAREWNYQSTSLVRKATRSLQIPDNGGSVVMSYHGDILRRRLLLISLSLAYSNQSKSHMAVARRVITYLKECPGLAITSKRELR